MIDHTQDSTANQGHGASIAPSLIEHLEARRLDLWRKFKEFGEFDEQLDEAVTEENSIRDALSCLEPRTIRECIILLEAAADHHLDLLTGVECENCNAGAECENCRVREARSVKLECILRAVIRALQPLTMPHVAHADSHRRGGYASDPLPMCELSVFPPRIAHCAARSGTDRHAFARSGTDRQFSRIGAR